MFFKKNVAMESHEIKSAFMRMVCIRKVEEVIGQAYLSREIGGFCHLCIGQEAIYGALSQVMQRRKSGAKYDDDAITGYRAHGFMFIKTEDFADATRLLIGELMGKSIGSSKGKGGSMHIFSTDNGFYGGHGIVGAQVALGTGLAFAHKYKKDGGITFVFMGDGAVNQGQVYESFNMASLWDLPVVYVVENNLYAMGTSIERASARTDFYNRGKSFGIDGEHVDAMCVFAAYEAFKKAADFCRSNSRPFILEMETYRYKGHSMSDPASYRTREEVDEYRKNRDPIEKLKSYIVANKVMTADEVKQLEGDLSKMVEDVAAECREACEPDASELYTDILTP